MEARRTRTWSEPLGRLGGWLLAPFTALGAAMRHARLFHPEGFLYTAAVSPLAGGPSAPMPDEGAALLAERLRGPALVRISSALWRGEREWIDALGCAIRFRRGGSVPSIEPSAGDQDLLFATIRSPWTLFFAPLKTHRHDFLRNDYYAVSPFFVEGLGKVKFRLRTIKLALDAPTRARRLERAVAEELASFLLEYKRLHRSGWHPLAAVRLERRVYLDQEALRFDPFRDGRGIHPIGFVQNLRPATYRMSQRFRPGRSTGPVSEVESAGYQKVADVHLHHREKVSHESGYLRTPLQGPGPRQTRPEDRAP